MLIKGFRFGMMLQLAVGPVCFFIFQIASQKGFLAAEAGVAGVALIDGLFILSAILGIASIMDHPKARFALKIGSSAVLFLFGISMVISLFGINLLPGIQIAGFSGTSSVFMYAVVLTASNPLTILFWAGIFSAKIIEENLRWAQLYIFGLAALFATVFFLTLVAGLGSLTHSFMTPFAARLLNFVVGVIFVYFSIRMMVGRQKSQG
ncbi:LysE family translocator [Paenibacillus caui]|uniref:LysE family translocator n=1 Tax=Paenibacillus caui TaxID=2873927 RepID=UPI001F31C29D|nr:LysE family transporter [Paenibacillus caui]